MPDLLTLKTNFKSLKYGKDRPNEGSSDQPYIVTDINKIDTDFSRLRLTPFDDGFVRGGVIGATNAAATDTVRITKFLIDGPKGPLFIARQVGLQLSNPKLESKELRTNNPTSGQGLLGNIGNFITNTVNRVTNAIGPTRIYNLGLNTLAQVPVNAFGVHFNRHGILPIQNEDNKYIKVVSGNNQSGNNRLLGYTTRFKLGDIISDPIPVRTPRSALPSTPRIKRRQLKKQAASGVVSNQAGKIAVGAISKKDIKKLIKADYKTLVAAAKQNRKQVRQQRRQLRKRPIELFLTQYLGGPGSVYGIGTTLIKRYDFTEDLTRYNEAIIWSEAYAGKTRDANGNSVEVKIADTKDFALSFIPSSNLSEQDFPEILYSDVTNQVIHSELQNSFIYNTGSSAHIDFWGDPSRASNRGTGYSQASFTNDYSDDIGTSTISISQSIADYDIANGTTSPVYDSNAINSAVNYNNAVTYALQTIQQNAGVTPGPVLKNYKDVFSQIQTQITQSQIYNKTVTSALPSNNNYYTQTNSNLGTPIIRKGVTGYTTMVGALTGSKYNYKNTTTPQDDICEKTPITKTIVDYSIGCYTSVKSQFNYFGGGGKITDVSSSRSFDRDSSDPYLITFTVYTAFGGTSKFNFNAYITNYASDYTSEWGDVKYVGRNENFYIFKNFKRTINLGLNIPELSNVNTISSMLQIGGNLPYSLAGQFSGGYLGGNLIGLKIPYVIDDQLGIINSLNITIPPETPWGGQNSDGAPQLIKMDVSFTVIGNNQPTF